MSEENQNNQPKDADKDLNSSKEENLDNINDQKSNSEQDSDKPEEENSNQETTNFAKETNNNSDISSKNNDSKDTSDDEIKDIMSEVDNNREGSFGKKLFLITASIALVMILVFMILKAIDKDEVATIKGSKGVTSEEFNKWYEIKSKQSKVRFDGPEYRQCIKDLRKQYYGGSDQDIKKQCILKENQIKASTLDYLITSRWMEAEAKANNIYVDNKEAEKTLDKRIKATFENTKEYDKYLKETSQTKEDLLERTKLELLSDKLKEKIIKDANILVTEPELKAYYTKNKKELDKPESRDTYILSTSSKEEAEKAIKELKEGKNFSQVVKEMKLEDNLGSQDGRYLFNVTKTNSPVPFSKEIYTSKVGVISKPIKNDKNYFVYQVEKDNKAGIPSFKDARETIKNTIIAQKEEQIMGKYLEEAKAKYKKLTECKDGFNFVEACNNYEALESIMPKKIKPSIEKKTETTPTN